MALHVVWFKYKVRLFLEHTVYMCNRKRTSNENESSWTLWSAISVSCKKTPDDVFEDGSKTSRSFVVRLDCLISEWCGKKQPSWIEAVLSSVMWPSSSCFFIKIEYCILWPDSMVDYKQKHLKTSLQEVLQQNHVMICYRWSDRLDTDQFHESFSSNKNVNWIQYVEFWTSQMNICRDFQCNSAYRFAWSLFVNFRRY